MLMEQVKGVGPSSQAWEARILPMNYTCIEKIVLIITFFSEKSKHIFDEFRKHPVQRIVLFCLLLSSSVFFCLLLSSSVFQTRKDFLVYPKPVFFFCVTIF